MGTEADRPPWQRAIESHLAKLTAPGLGFRKAALLWISAFSVVVAACAVFFLIIYWLFG